MKKYLVTLAGSLLLGATAAMAAPQQYPDQHGQQAQNRHGQRAPVKYVHDNRGIHDNRGRYYVAHDNGQHAGWYKRGGHLPPQYRANRYYVSNWSAYHLRPPPSGYRWVRSDNSDFLLVAVATGIITDIVLSH